jgi:outer membrane putative beta-barrel porin/alpha-amylase
MQFHFKRLVCALLILLAQRLCAQDLVPRAYVITPVGANAVILTWSYSNGGVNFSGAIPVTGATGSFSTPNFSYYHSFGFFGRSANITASLPYGVGNFKGEAGDRNHSVYRSGLVDVVARLSVNLIGGRAMPAREFSKWKQKRLLGASVKVLAPTGQYDPAKLVNWGINRWAFKPEVGYSQRWGSWLVDAYAGAWFYTTNRASYSVPVPQPQTEGPIGSLEAHLSRNFGPGTWVSLDGNFWWGGVTSLNGIQNLATKQTSSRLGGTLAWRFTKHQSLKVSYSDGTYVRFGGNFQNVQIGWQYSWIGLSKKSNK